MVQPSDVTPTVWWRFDRYQIENNLICPAPSAQLKRYDPWEYYRQGRSRRKNTESPYQSLLALYNNVTFSHSYELTPNAKELIVAWCNDHGLLGVLLQSVQQVVLAARWETTDLEPDVSSADQVAKSNRLLVPKLIRYIRYNTGWEERKTFKPVGEDALIILEEPEMQGQLVSDDDRPIDWPQPGILVRELTDPLWRHEPLHKYWGSFFPKVRSCEKDTFLYPRPGSKEFWKLYAEPVMAFLNGALALRDIVRDLSHISPLGETTQEDQQRVRRGIKSLHSLVAPISPGIQQLDDGSIEQRWVAPSLQATFAMMLLQDLSAQKRVLSCGACGQLFLSSAYQARYCSETCRFAEQKRRWRAKRKQKEKNHGQARSE